MRYAEIAHGPPADTDPLLIESPQIVATADSVILDGCARWLNLARRTVDRRLPDVEPVDLSGR